MRFVSPFLDPYLNGMLVEQLQKTCGCSTCATHKQKGLRGIAGVPGVKLIRQKLDGKLAHVPTSRDKHGRQVWARKQTESRNLTTG